MIPRTVANYTFKDLLSATRAGMRSDGRPVLRARLKQSTGAKHVILVPSARAGLALLFGAIDRPRIICPAYTCNAVVDAIRLAGKQIDFVPLAASGFNADTQAVERLAGPDAVILMTHQFGQFCDIDTYRRIAEQTGALLVEDAAAAQGGGWNGRPAGNNGIASVISFESAKILHAPLHGGAVFCSDDALCARLESAITERPRDSGWLTGVRHWLAAGVYTALRNRLLYSLFHFVNFRIRNRHSAEAPLAATPGGAHYSGGVRSWQAHLLCLQLDTLAANTRRRREIFSQFRALLADLPARRLPDPAGPEDACARCAVALQVDRTALVQSAWREGIDLGTAFSCIEAPEDFVEEWEVAGSIVNIPLYPQLTAADIHRILRFLESALGEDRH